MSKSKYNVYYGTEENGYEEDFLGEFDSLEEAKAFVAENLEEDFESAEDATAAIAEIDDNGYEGEDGKGYHILYIIGERDFCLSALYGMREDFLEQFEEDE